MYGEADHFHPYFQNYSKLPEGFFITHNLHSPLSNMVQTSTVCENNMGGEGDLFKAPEPIIEESFSCLDPMMDAPCGNTNMSLDVLKEADIFLSSSDADLLQSDQLLSEVYYEFEKDLLQKGAMQTLLSEVLDLENQTSKVDEFLIPENKTVSDATLQKSVSSGCLGGVDMTVNEVYGMRRAFSEGDIKTLSIGNGSQFHSPLQQPLLVNNCTAEERKEKLSRYRNKKTKRNFGRKIKYACRKALADSQPRIKGRFAKTEE